MNALLHDNLAGVRQIKVSACENEEHARFNRVSDHLRRATLVVMRVWAIYSPSMSLFESIGALLGARVWQSRGAYGFDADRRSGRVSDSTRISYDPLSRLHQLNQLGAGRTRGGRACI